MNLSEKVSYLRGLLEGMDIDPNSKEAKIYNAIVDVLDDAALSVADLEDQVAELEEYIDEIDADLGEAEEYLYGDDECDCCGDDDEEEYPYEAVCPECGTVVTLPVDVETDDEIECPECGEHFEIELPDDDCCDCGCDCEDEDK